MRAPRPRGLGDIELGLGCSKLYNGDGTATVGGDGNERGSARGNKAAAQNEGDVHTSHITTERSLGETRSAVIDRDRP